MKTKTHNARALACALLLALGIMLGSCQVGEPEQVTPALINKIEVNENQVSVFASRKLEPGAYILPSPPRLMVTVENAELGKGLPLSGGPSGNLIKSWSFEQKSIKQQQGDEEKEMKIAQLSLELSQNITYKVTEENSGFSVGLEEVKKVESSTRTEKIEIPKELYPQIQKLSINTEGQPTGKAVVPIGLGDEKEAREMLKNIIPERAQAEKLAPAKNVQDISYRSTEGTFEAIIVGDGEFGDYKLMSLDKPLRIVVDFYGVKSTLNKEVFLANSGKIAQIRVGTYPNKTRVVVEIKGSQIKDAREVSLQNKMIIKILF